MGDNPHFPSQRGTSAICPQPSYPTLSTPSGLIWPWCGAPQPITDEQAEQVVVRILETKPANATDWTTRSAPEASVLRDTTVLRVLHAFGLQPHRSETF